MSRSYKRYAGYVDRNPYMKRYANRRFRRTCNDIASGNAYRRYTCSYDICDWRSVYFNVKTLNDYRQYVKQIESSQPVRYGYRLRKSTDQEIILTWYKMKSK